VHGESESYIMLIDKGQNYLYARWRLGGVRG